MKQDTCWDNQMLCCYWLQTYFLPNLPKEYTTGSNLTNSLIIFKYGSTLGSIHRESILHKYLFSN